MVTPGIGRYGRSAVLVLAAAVLCTACDDDEVAGPGTPDDPDLQTAREIFRFSTFENETFWTDTLRMHEVIESAVDPLTALAVGLKVDADALPAGILAQADLADPATTVELLRLDAVVGLKAEVDPEGNLVRVGTTCALCHSTVDNSVQPGIGVRLDGWPNRDLDPGLILSLSPALQDPNVQAALTSWGPGRFDPRFNQDGISDPVLIPPAYGLANVPLTTYTGDGDIQYWNAYVAVTQMHGHGDFSDPRIGVSVDWPEDVVTPALDPLEAYQSSLDPPEPPAGSFDPAGAEAGREVFEGSGRCAECHTGPSLSDAGTTLHDAAETCMDPGWADRSATGQYRTTPLRGLWQHPPYFHDGSAETLEDVVDHYDACLDLGLTDAEVEELVEYLKSI